MQKEEWNSHPDDESLKKKRFRQRRGTMRCARDRKHEENSFTREGSRLRDKKKEKELRKEWGRIESLSWGKSKVSATKTQGGGSL